MKRILIALTILASAVVGTQASLILSDDFNSYNLGPIVGQSAWINVSGTAGTSQVTNGPVDKVLEISGASARSEDIAQVLPGGPYMTNGSIHALYSKFTVRFVSPPSTAAGAYFAHFTGDAISFNYHGRIWASLTNANAGVANYVTNGGYFYLGIGNSSGAMGVTTGAGQLTNVFTTNVTYTIVTRFVMTNGVATMWLNPSAETDPGATANDPNDITNYNNITWYGFRQATGPGLLWVDDFKVGTTFADVAGVNQSPSVSSITTQSIPKGGSTAALPFTVSDPETAANLLTVTATSDDLTVVPNGSPNIVLASDGGGTNRTITVTPAAAQQGSANITINANDGVNDSFTTFKVIVGEPSISAIGNRITSINTATPAIPFTVTDAENDTLTITKTSSNPTLVTTAGIAIGGSGSNRYVTVTPESGQTGVATITLSVTDSYNTNSSSFVVTVSPSLGVIFSEPFDYADGQLYGSGSWTHASPTGTNFGQLQVTNGQAQLSRSQAEDVSAALTGAPYAASNGVVFYTGFRVAFAELPSSSGGYFLHLKDSDTGTSFHAKVFANTANAATGKFRLGVSSSANTPTQFSRDLVLNQPYVVVTRYNSGTGETRLWVNPTSEASSSVDSTDNPQTSTIGSIGLREDSGIGTNYVDNIKISTSFVDVVPSIVRPPLKYEADGLGNFILSWTNALFELQGATDVSNGIWETIDPLSPVPVDVSPSYTNNISGQQFFRLRY